MILLSRLSKRMQSIIFGAVLVLSQATPFVALAPRVSADTGGGNTKVKICHRTSSATNPYSLIEVDENAVDGEAGNSGQIPDHYGEHVGPLASSEEVANQLKDDKKEWGDIIPPVSPYHEGLNWTTEGQAIYNNDCNLISEDATVQVKKVVINPNVPEDKFDLYIDGNKVLTDAVNGSMSEKVVIDEDESVEVKETPGTGLTNFDDYTTTIVCTNQLQEIVANYSPTGSSSRSKSINKNDIEEGDSILCVFTNTRVEVPEVDFCDPSDRPAGMSIGEWLEENDFNGADCFELEPIQTCGSFDIEFNDLTGLGFEVRYVEGDETPELANWAGDGTLPVNFDEDYNGGSVEITYYIVGPERDYVEGTTLPNIWDANGTTVEVDTDCEENKGTVVVTKFNDEDKDGLWDEGEEVLPDWDIQLTGLIPCYDDLNDVSAYNLVRLVVELPELCDNKEAMYEKTTDENGEATFEVNKGVYRVSETLKDGWEQTGIYCDPLEDRLELSRVQEYDEEDSVPTDIVKVYAGQTRNCYVGNYQTPEEPEEPEAPGQVLGTTTTPTPQVLASTGSDSFMAMLASLLLIGATAGLSRVVVNKQ